ncbi:MAG: carboxypeptidase regulatory-like domain-containing protein, partial [Planctomycetaceae bacterium]|nr:carboxypeptidase regulatory-like domain-containing protein [Planctomycetaceae bacterium]
GGGTVKISDNVTRLNNVSADLNSLQGFDTSKIVSIKNSSLTINGQDLRLTKCTDYSNTTFTVSGGGTVTLENGSTLISLTSGNLRFAGTATYKDGVLRTGAAIQTNGTVTIRNAQIVAMRSDSAIYHTTNTALTIVNSVIANGREGVYCTNGTVTMVNCTVGNNHYGLRLGTSGSITAYNSIVAANTGFDVYENRAIAGTHNLSSYTAWTTPAANFVYDPAKPLFVDAEWNDFRLMPGSQAINLGDNDIAYEYELDETTFDYLGKPRISSGTIDIGAQEFEGHLSDQVSVFCGNVTFRDFQYGKAQQVRLSWISGTTTSQLGTFGIRENYVWDTTLYADGQGFFRVEYLDELGNIMNTSNTPGTIINDPNIVVHRMAIEVDERWQADKVHIVLGRVQVNHGVTLFIESDAVVKFWRNSHIFLEDTAAIDIGASVIFTRAEDDSVIGDSNKDGHLSVPKNGREYVRGNGAMTQGADVTMKYLVRTYSGTITSDQTWYGGQVYHVTGNVTVASGVTLTIMPGAIIKFEERCSLIVNAGGTLIAEGTAAQPIIFTSIKDDTYGGDTNEDEDWSTPQPGNWNEIRNNGGTISLNHTRILYGGWGAFTNQGDGMLRNVSGTMTIQNSILKGSLLRLVSVGSGDVTITNTILEDGMWGVDGRATLTNCIITNCTTSLSGSGGTLVNSIVYNSGAVSGYAVSYSAFWKSGTMPSGVGNLAVDPMFYDAANGDYRLRPGSPLIDAGDATRAAATDFTGAPRVNDPYITNKKGVPNADGNYVDMGVYEFVDYALSSIDLEPVDIQAPATVTTGERITIQWTIRNNGSAPATGTWTDLILLVSDRGEVVRVGEITHSGNIIGNDLQTYFAEVLVPCVADGNWRFVVQVNIHRNIFEGPNIGNNEISAAAWTTVAVPRLTEKELNIAVYKGMPQLYRIDIPAGEAFALSAYSESAVSIYLAEGRAPSATSFDFAAATDGNGNYALYVPAATTAQTLYLLISTERGVPTVSVTVSEKTLDLVSVAQSQVGNAGTSTIGFIGAGFDETMTVALRFGSTVITGANLSVVSGASASAQFDLKGVVAGAYDLIVTKGGVSVTLERAVTVTPHGIGARLEADFTIPDSVRAGRIYEVWLVYENTGDSDMLVPVFTVWSNSDTHIGLTADSLTTGSEIFILGAGSPDSAGILRPGEKAKVAFYFQATEWVNLSFGAWWTDNADAPMFENDYWTTWADYHRDLSETVTLLGSRGYLTSDFNEVDSFLLARKAGQDTTGLSGQLRNTQTGEAIANATILAEWTADGETNFAYTTTDDNGHYVFNYLPADGTVTLSLVDKAYDLSVTTVQMKDGKDINGFPMTATTYGMVSGFVNRDGGRGGADVLVFATNSLGETVSTMTDSRGFFLLDSLKWDTWTIEVLGSGLSLPSQTVTVNSSALVTNVSFTLAASGSLSGRVFDSANNPVADTTVVVVNDLGEWVAVGVTNESGTYRIEDVPVGTHSIRAFSETLTWTQQEVIVKLNETTTINFIAVSSSLSGTIFTQGGSPVTEGTVVIYSVSNSNDPVFQFVIQSAGIDTDGSYRFDSLVPGEYIIEVYTESGTAFVRVIIGDSSNSLNITFVAQTDFSGKVNFASPIPQGESIYVLMVSEDETVQIFVEVDGEGNFIVGKIPQGTYRIIVVSEEGILAEQEVVLDTTVQTVQIDSSHVFPERSAGIDAMAMQSDFIAIASGLSYSFVELTAYWWWYGNFGAYSKYVDNTLVKKPECFKCTSSNQRNYNGCLMEARLAKSAYQTFDQNMNSAKISLVDFGLTGAAVIGYTSIAALKAANLAVMLGVGKGTPIASVISTLSFVQGVVQAGTNPGNLTVVGVSELTGRLTDARMEVAKASALLPKVAAQVTVLAGAKGALVAVEILHLKEALDRLAKEIENLQIYAKNLGNALSRASEAYSQVAEHESKIGWYKSQYKSCTCKKVPPPPPNPPKRPPGDDKDRTPPISWDPNEINGPIGYDFDGYDAGTEEDPYFVITTPNWITDNRDQTITIYFENKASAAAAAQEVFVEIAMPPQWDYDTFVLEEICIGNQIFTQMADSTDGTWFLQQTSTGQQIQLVVSFDTDTGYAHWYLRSWVITTADKFPVSAYDGFLPPNDETHRGEGYIMFNIRMKDGLETGTVVESFASIIFDTNDPIITNIWINTIDSTAPTSYVLPLDEISKTNRFLVEWTGSDIGSGVAFYDVYVSVDSGEFEIWQRQTPEIFAYFEGENGKTYAFYSIATDNVGLLETSLKNAEAVTTVIGGSVEMPSVIVTTLDDIIDEYDGLISLREAIAYAGTNGLGTTITFAASLQGQTITLNGCRLLIDKNITIDAGTQNITVDANQQSGVFYIGQGTTVVLAGLTITGGNASAYDDDLRYDDCGGGIYNEGTLT